MQSLVTTIDRSLSSFDQWMTDAIRNGTMLWISAGIVLFIVLYTRKR